MRKLKPKVLLVVTIVLAGLGFLSSVSNKPVVQKGIATGNYIPEISGKLLSGKYFSTDSLKGKMVLINVWASYDAVSRVENNQLNALYKSFEDAKFQRGTDLEIVSISLDRFKTPLYKAIENDQMHWSNHLCDLQGRESKWAKQLDVYENFYYLIDGNQMIVAKKKSIAEIENCLKLLVVK